MCRDSPSNDAGGHLKYSIHLSRVGVALSCTTVQGERHQLRVNVCFALLRPAGPASCIKHALCSSKSRPRPLTGRAVNAVKTGGRCRPGPRSDFRPVTYIPGDDATYNR
jgi:hypothetical protein